MIRRTLWTVLLLGVACIARGQTEYNYHYWFDNAETIGTATLRAADHWQTAVDVSTLTPSLHRIHIAFQDDEGHISPTCSQLFYKLLPEQQQMASSVTYWYDHYTADRKETRVVNGTFTVEGVDMLGVGLHKLSAIIRNTMGDMPSTVTTLFYIPFNPAVEHFEGFSYWFDDDTHQHVALSGNNIYELSTSHLSSGLHTIHLQTDNRFASPAVSQMFYKPPFAKHLSSELKCLISIDGQQVLEEVVADTGGLVQIDADGLSVGLHNLSVVTTTNDETGEPLSTESTIFYYGGKREIETVTGYAYWFDGNVRQKYEGELNGIVTLNTGDLKPGLHTVHVQTNGSHLSPAASQLFYKMPATYYDQQMNCVVYVDGVRVGEQAVGTSGGLMTINTDGLRTGLHYLTAALLTSDGKEAIPGYSAMYVRQPGLSHYEYWVNDNETSLVMQPIEGSPLTYSLMAQLPVSEEPIRSDSFVFAIEDDAPVVYGKQDLYVRFYNEDGYSTTDSRPFVDTRVKQMLGDIPLLQSGVTETTEVPAANELRWYKLMASASDSLRFMLSQKATYQLFTPSAEELLVANGDESTTWKGITVPEDGIYYLALYDATVDEGTESINIDYENLGHSDVSTGIASSDYRIWVTPHVASSRITVHAERGVDHVALYSVGGNLIHSFDAVPDGFTLDVSNLSSGIYLVMVKSENVTIQEKIIVRHR